MEKQDYRQSWQYKNLDRIYLKIKKGGKAKLQDAAEKSGKSLNMFITESLEKQTGLNLH